MAQTLNLPKGKKLSTSCRETLGKFTIRLIKFTIRINAMIALTVYIGGLIPGGF